MDLASIGLMPAIIILVTIAIGAIMKGITGLGLPIFAIPIRQRPKSINAADSELKIRFVS